MSNSKNSKAKGEKKAANSGLGRVPINTTVTPEIYSRLVAYQKAKGFLTAPQVVRVAIVALLDASGY